jgi:iron(III) transport system substrate-binding protein
MTSARSRMSRRRFVRAIAAAGGVLVAGGAAQACGARAPASPSPPTGAQGTAPPQAGAAGSPEWDRLLAAAKQEGKLSILVPPGDVYRRLPEEFQKQYGIQVETLAGNGNVDLVPRVSAERQAGQSNWDLVTHSPGSMLVGFRRLGAMEPLAPALILPDALDDARWLHGFVAGWADLDQAYVYSYTAFVDIMVKVNRNVVPEAELSRLEQLWEPRWKGRIAMYDPRVPGAGLQAVAVLVLTLGEDRVRQFLDMQQPVLTTDRRQLGEWIVRGGQYPIALGVAPDSFGAFRSQGVDTSQIKALDPDNVKGAVFTAGTGSIGLFSQAPHPNAAKAYANWFLTQEAQALYAQTTGFNSRRLDVPVADPDYQPDPTKDYLNIDIESNYDARDRALAIAKETLK